MKVAVITPYYREPLDILKRCHDSIQAQTIDCHHIMVSDGHPREDIDQWPVTHIRLPKAHGDYGDTAKAVGSIEAMGSNFDALTYIDADNAFSKNHLEVMVRQAKKTQAGMITCTRTFFKTNGEPMGICHNCDGDEFCDTNCMLITKPAFRLCMEWVTMPSYGHAICDRIFWFRAKQLNIARSHIDHAGVHYYVYHQDIYRALGEPVPHDADHNPAPLAQALKRWEEEGNPSLRFKFRGEKL